MVYGQVAKPSVYTKISIWATPTPTLDYLLRCGTYGLRRPTTQSQIQKQHPPSTTIGFGNINGINTARTMRTSYKYSNQSSISEAARKPYRFSTSLTHWTFTIWGIKGYRRSDLILRTISRRKMEEDSILSSGSKMLPGGWGYPNLISWSFVKRTTCWVRCDLVGDSKRLRGYTTCLALQCRVRLFTH